VKLHRALAIARKNLRSLKHDRRTVGFLVLMPLLMITIFGYTFGGNVRNVNVYIVNLDEGADNQSVASAIIADIETRDTLHIVKTYSLRDLVIHGLDPVSISQEEVQHAHIWAAIIFNQSFSEDIAKATSPTGGPPATIRLMIDGTNPNIVTAVTGDLQLAIRSVLGERAFVAPITVVPDLVYGKDARFIDFFAPGVMGLAAMMVTFMLSIISFVHERSTSTLDRLLSTPVTEGEIVAGYALAFGLIGLIQSCVIIVTAVLLFQIQIVGNPLIVLLIIFVFGVGNQGLGFLLSSVARNEFQAIQFLPLILFPSILLAGVFWPIEAVPTILRPVSYFIPLTYAVDAMRSVMIRGWGLGSIWLQFGILLLFAGVMLTLSTYGLKKRR
jgi:ABC-2 type transport system permease protein